VAPIRQIAYREEGRVIPCVAIGKYYDDIKKSGWNLSHFCPYRARKPEIGFQGESSPHSNKPVKLVSGKKPPVFMRNYLTHRMPSAFTAG
jgi:hypothetical protein